MKTNHREAREVSEYYLRGLTGRTQAEIENLARAYLEARAGEQELRDQLARLRAHGATLPRATGEVRLELPDHVLDEYGF